MATMPNEKDRAYEKAALINDLARAMTGNDIFPLNGLSTSVSAMKNN